MYIYQQYKKTVDNPVDYKTHKKVLDTWGEVLVSYLLEGKDVRLHSGMSVLGIRKKKKRTYVDRQASKKAGKLVIKLNTHSGFYHARVYWRKNYTQYSAKGWVFKPARALSRALGAVMQQPHGHAKFVKQAKVISKKD